MALAPQVAHRVTQLRRASANHDVRITTRADIHAISGGATLVSRSVRVVITGERRCWQS